METPPLFLEEIPYDTWLANDVLIGSRYLSPIYSNDSLSP